MSITLEEGLNKLDVELTPIPQQVGVNVRNITTDSADLGAGATVGCYFTFWLGTSQVAQSGFIPAHTDYWTRVSGLTPGMKYTFTAIGTYNSRTISGSMNFTTVALPPPPTPPTPSDFEYSNMKLLTPRIPGEVEYYTEVSCDIRNIVDRVETREVSLWLMSPSWDTGNWWKITYPSFIDWESWAIPPGGLDWDPGTISLTLAPGETYHFHYAGCAAAWHDYFYAQLRDDIGGSSAIVKKYAG